jgi:LysR family glycine cleavage system transcriptional activator
MRLVSIDSLQCFAVAAKLLNFRAAARSVALTPAAFGQRIKQLEELLGIELFRRTTRSVHLTEAGLALLPFAEKTIADAQACVLAARGETAMAPHEIVIGTRYELGLSWLLPQLDPLAERHPWLQLHLYFGSGPDLLAKVRTMEIDCAVTSMRLIDPKLDSLRLHREEYVFVASAALLRKRPLTRVEHGLAHALIDVDGDLPLFRYWRDAASRKLGDRLRFGQTERLGTIEAIRRRLLAGAGVAVLPEYLVRKDIASRRLRVVFPAIEPNADYFRLVFRRDDPRRAVYETIARALLEFPLR